MDRRYLLYNVLVIYCNPHGCQGDTIKGTQHRSVVLSEARVQIQQLLIQQYDKNSPQKREKALVQDFYLLMNNLGIFDQHADIEISIDEPATPANLTEMLFIDIDKTMAQLILNY